MTELNRQALAFVSVVIFVAVLFGYFFAVGISTPIRGLAASTRAISRGEFHQRTPVRGAAEISELAENFNLMANDIEEYIERLKEAAEENRELFIGSIRMLAAAIDEKDPVHAWSLWARGEIFQHHCAGNEIGRGRIG